MTDTHLRSTPIGARVACFRMDLDITPEPSDAERAAIETALAEVDETAVNGPSPWSQALLPQREEPLEP